MAPLRSLILLHGFLLIPCCRNTIRTRERTAIIYSVFVDTVVLVIIKLIKRSRHTHKDHEIII